MAKQSMGELISQFRKEQGMTQKDLADKMNVTDKAVSKWERNLSCPDINSLPTLAEALGVSVEELLNTTKREEQSNSKVDQIVDLALKVITLAMGVAVVVTSVLKQIDLHSGFTMLGIGLACIGIRQLKES